MLREMYESRALMPVWDDGTQVWENRRKEIIKLLCEEEYGFMPRSHDSLTCETLSEDSLFCAGKVTLSKIMLTATFGEDKFSFPIYASIPKSSEKLPFFVCVNFTPNVPDKFLPIEEICDRGFAVISFGYQDIAADASDIIAEKTGRPDRLKDILFGNTRKEKNHCGKIGLWAWALSRAMDYACTLDSLDHDRAAAVGHSRLGKTALLAGMLDERFSCVISNDSGCSGASVSRMKIGETIRNITDKFPYWFCENYKKYADKEDTLPFDQHFLLASIAPRKVYVTGASENTWGDPYSAFLSCFAANEVYEKLGMKGFVCADRMPEAGERFHEGNIGYHLRKGTHYLGREDWNNFIDYLTRN